MSENLRIWTEIGFNIFYLVFIWILVILFVQKIPAMGMLMIPKTIAYLLMAVAVYRKFFRPVPSR